MDAAPEDSTIVAELRAKGAIIYAKANLSEYNGGGGNPGGREGDVAHLRRGRAQRVGAARPATPTTARSRPAARARAPPRRSAATSSTCSICEETGGSCRQPAWRNGVGRARHHQGPDAVRRLDRRGAVSRPRGHRLPHGARHRARARRAAGPGARLLRSARHLQRAAARDSSPTCRTPVSRCATATRAGEPLAGVRIGVVREYMVKHAANDAGDERPRRRGDQARCCAISSARRSSSRSIPKYPDDPSIPNMEYDFSRRFGRDRCRSRCPSCSVRRTTDGALLYAVSGFDVTQARLHGRSSPRAWRRLSPDLNLRSVNSSPAHGELRLPPGAVPAAARRRAREGLGRA